MVDTLRDALAEALADGDALEVAVVDVIRHALDCAEHHAAGRCDCGCADALNRLEGAARG